MAAQNTVKLISTSTNLAKCVNPEPGVWGFEGTTNQGHPFRVVWDDDETFTKALTFLLRRYFNSVVSGKDEDEAKKAILKDVNRLEQGSTITRRTGDKRLSYAKQSAGKWVDEQAKKADRKFTAPERNRIIDTILEDPDRKIPHFQYADDRIKLEAKQKGEASDSLDSLLAEAGLGDKPSGIVRKKDK